MKPELRVVFDTNAIVSALLVKGSVPRQAFDTVADHGFLLASETTIQELSDVLRRPKFEKYVSEAERFEFLRAFVAKAMLFSVRETIQASRDPTDDKFLELAVSGDAKYIVSGDPDLLALDPFRGIRIIRPADFLATAKQLLSP